MQEIVCDGQTGLHFTPGDSTDLAQKVEWAWNNPSEVEAMGLEARRQYEGRYTAERNYELLMGIYEKALQSHGRTKIVVDLARTVSTVLEDSSGLRDKKNFAEPTP